MMSNSGENPTAPAQWIPTWIDMTQGDDQSARPAWDPDRACTNVLRPALFLVSSPEATLCPRSFQSTRTSLPSLLLHPLSLEREKFF